MDYAATTPGTAADFGRLKDGRPASLFHLHSNEMDVAITDYGARIVSMTPAGTNGRSVVLGFGNVAAYEADNAFHGAFCGRYANRIVGAQYEWGGKIYKLPANDPPHTLHGGPEGFHRKLWALVSEGPDHVTFSLRSPDGDQGFPGKMDVEVSFTLTGSTLRIGYQATATCPTPVSFTHHPYFNLDGGPRIDAHSLMVPCDRILTDFDQYTGGEATRTLDTQAALDFREMRWLREAFEALYPSILDHTYGPCTEKGSILESPEAACRLTVQSDMPALQVYAGGHLGGGPNRPGGAPYQPFEGICLEPQEFPLGPEIEGYPPNFLLPGETYRRYISYTYEKTE